MGGFIEPIVVWGCGLTIGQRKGRGVLDCTVLISEMRSDEKRRGEERFIGRQTDRQTDTITEKEQTRINRKARSRKE